MLRYWIFFISLMVWVPITHADNTKMLFAYEDKHNFPFYIGDSTSIEDKKPGVSVEVVQLMGKKLGLNIEFKRMPWKRCLSDLERNAIDGTFNASFKKERMQYGVYPMKGDQADPDKRITTIAYVLYKLKDSPLQWDGTQFKNLEGSIGAPIGYSIVDDLKKMGVVVDESKDTLKDLSKLLVNRIAAVAALELAGDFYLNTHAQEFRNIVKVNPPLATKPYYVMLSHQYVQKNPELAKKIWSTLETIRESQETKKITEKYFQ